MYSGFDEWKQTQIENMPKQSKARQFASVRLEIQELLHNECSNFFNDKAGFEWKYSKTGGCTGYADKKKFLAITAKGSKGAFAGFAGSLPSCLSRALRASNHLPITRPPICAD